MAAVDVFPTESPYRGDKIHQIFAQGMDPEDMVDEFAPPFVDPKKHKTYFIPENPDNGSLEITVPEGTEALIWPPCSSYYPGGAWSELPKNLPKSLKILDLGHDGLLYGNRPTSESEETEEEKSEGKQADERTAWKKKMLEDQTVCREILKSLPNLEKVYYCGYYSEVDYEEIAKDFPHITFEPIY